MSHKAIWITGIDVMSELTRNHLLRAVISGRGPAYLRGIDLSKLDLSNAGWLVEADLRQARLSNTNLSRANLRESKLEKANLESSNLTGANLEFADLRDAKLTTANLKLANLRGASLQGATLIGAALVGANLQGANLEGADLEGADLQGADLRDARFGRANLKMANLKGANLESVMMRSTSAQGEGSENRPISMPAHGFAGSLKGVGLADLIQLICLSRSNLLFQVESSVGHGAIHVRSGRVCHAEMNDLRGEKAFFEILKWDTGRFEVLPFSDNGAVTIEKSIEHLLVESFRRRDEMESPWNEPEQLF